MPVIRAAIRTYPVVTEGREIDQIEGSQGAWASAELGMAVLGVQLQPWRTSWRQLRCPLAGGQHEGAQGIARTRVVLCPRLACCQSEAARHHIPGLCALSARDLGQAAA
jgi:hypothetical protein